MGDAPTPAVNILQTYIDAISRDQWVAIENLAVLSVLRSSAGPCPTAWQGSGFLPVLGDTAGAALLMALARMLDDDKRGESVTIIGVCNYAQQNPGQSLWLYGAGKIRFPDGDVELLARCNKWRTWVQELGIKEDIKKLRDKVLAHRDKKHVLGELEIASIVMPEVRAAVKTIGSFVNEMGRLVADVEVGDWYLYEQIFNDGADFLAVQEAKWQLLTERPERELWTQHVRPIRQAIDEQHVAIFGESHVFQQ